MPWNAWHYPAAMKYLTPAARMKAIEIANALLAEGRAIRITIVKGKEWAAHHGRTG